MSSNPRPVIKATVLKRATPKTKFQIDFDWWDKSNLDIRTYLASRLNISDEASLEIDMDEVDLVDDVTGEVQRVDGFQYVIQAYFSQMPEDFAVQTSLVDGAFCVLLANANRPMTATELAEKTGHSVNTVVKTLGGPRVYQGIRPVHD